VTFEPLRSNHLAENVYCYVVEAETAGEAFVAEALVVGVVVGYISSCLAYSCESRPC